MAARGAPLLMFVLDAATALSWAFPDESSETADMAWRLLRDDSAAVPGVWWFELRNLLLLGERHGRIGAERVESFLTTLSSQPIVFPPRPSDKAIFAVARRWKLTIYDAAYLELAQRLKAPLATLDRRLAQAAEGAGVRLIRRDS